MVIRLLSQLNSTSSHAVLEFDEVGIRVDLQKQME